MQNKIKTARDISCAVCPQAQFLPHLWLPLSHLRAENCRAAFGCHIPIHLDKTWVSKAFGMPEEILTSVCDSHHGTQPPSRVRSCLYCLPHTQLLLLIHCRLLALLNPMITSAPQLWLPLSQVSFSALLNTQIHAQFRAALKVVSSSVLWQAGQALILLNRVGVSGLIHWL